MKLLKKPTIDALRKLRIFADIPDDELKHIYEMVECRQYQVEESIIEENSPGDHIFVLTSGKVKIVKLVAENRTEVLGYYDEMGGLFGEMAILEDKPRSAGMVADSDCEVLALSRDAFLELVQSVPLFSLAVAKNISQFLRETDERFINMLRQENDALRQANHLLQETQEALINKERLALIGRMASTILHDMKNPMSTIGGYAQLIKMKKHTQKQLTNYAEIISRQVIQFTSMAQDLLTFAQGGDQMNLKSIEAAEYLKECCSSLKLKFDEHEAVLKCDLNFKGVIRLDTGRFFRVLDNITTNALDVLGEGGLLTIHSEEVETGLRVIMEDNGPGMSEEVQQNAFKEFYTAGKRKGTGLGLAIVKRIVDEHEGLVSIESKVGEGTKFIIDLPAVGYDLLPQSKHQIPIPFEQAAKKEEN